MKALSIRMPWAWCICHAPEPDRKPVENRTWYTHIRGDILVHAGKLMSLPEYEADCAWIRARFPSLAIPTFAELRKLCGGIVGQTRIRDCVTSHPSKWFTGPHGWLLTDSKPLPFRPYPGAQGFFTVDQPNQPELL